MVYVWFAYTLTRGTCQEKTRQRVVQIVFTQKLTGALQQVNMCAHPVMSCRTHAGPKGISKMVEARSTSASLHWQY